MNADSPIPTPWRRAGAVFAAALVCSGAATAQTSFFSSVLAHAQHTDPGVLDPFQDDALLQHEAVKAFGRISVTADSDHQASEFHAFARAWSQVDVAGVHLFTRSDTVAIGAGEQRANAVGEARGFFSDYFALHVPGAAPGALFTVTAQLRSHGTTSATFIPAWSGQYSPNTSGASTHWESWARLIGGGKTLAEVRARQDCAGASNMGSPPACYDGGTIGLATVTFQMAQGGAPVQLDLRGFMRAGSSVQLVTTGMLEATGISDMSNTLAWAGVSMLQDFTGNLVADYTLGSATSGFDYRQAYVSAVPEPATPLLLLGGLALMGGWRRRR